MSIAVCVYCRMDLQQLCICDHKKSEQKVVPDMLPPRGQTCLPVEKNDWQRLQHWRAWMATEGVRLGLWVEPKQHLSSQDRVQKRLVENKEPK